jgi:hypothetical protein
VHLSYAFGKHRSLDASLEVVGVLLCCHSSLLNLVARSGEEGSEEVSDKVNEVLIEKESGLYEGSPTQQVHLKGFRAVFERSTGEVSMTAVGGLHKDTAEVRWRAVTLPAIMHKRVKSCKRAHQKQEYSQTGVGS